MEELKKGEIIEKDGRQLEYLGDGKFKEVSILAKRFLDEKGEFVLHRGPALTDAIQR